MEEALMTLLLGNSSLASYVDNKINWSVRPQVERLPCVTLNTISGIHQLTNDGPSNLVTYRIQIDCWAATAEAVTTLKNLIIGALQGQRTFVFSSDSPSRNLGEIQGAVVLNERRLFEESANGAEKFHRVSVDFNLWHAEVV